MDKICILATGGTMDKVHDVVGEKLVFSDHSLVPEILHECRADGIEHEVIMLIDSLDMTDDDRQEVLKAILRRSENRIIVTHGTSTMPETAEYLKDKVKDRTIVLTGAMRPFSLFQSDAPFNLGAAITAARVLPAGVYIAMNGQIFEAGKVEKNVVAGRFERI